MNVEQQDPKEPKKYTIESAIPIKIELSQDGYTFHYNNDLSHQLASFIMVKNVIEKLINDRAQDKSFKKERTSFIKMNYQLGEFIGGMAAALIERVIAQEESDKTQASADAIGLEIIKP